MKRFIFVTLCVASSVVFFATADAQTNTNENTAAFVGLRFDESGQRYGLVGITTKITDNVISISRSDIGGTANLSQEFGYAFRPTKWLNVIPLISLGLESEIPTNPAAYITGGTGLAVSATIDDFIGWGVWAGWKHTAPFDPNANLDNNNQWGLGLFFGI